MSSSNLVQVAYKKEETYGETPAAVKASLLNQDLTYTAVKGGELGNEITIEYVDDGSAGSETVEVNGTAIIVHIEANASTADQIKAAIDASTDASELVTVEVTGTGSNAQDSGLSAAVATLNLTADITLTSVAEGSARNTNTLTLQVLPADDNPTDTILVGITGTNAAIIVTVTPNDGTNNGAVPVDLTTAELAELINTGAVVGKNITLTDVGSRRILQTASGGGATALADGGEGDGVIATFTGGTDDEETPLASGDKQWKTARFTQEKYSGTPETTESQQIRTDRMSSGQVVTGLNVEGGHNFELAVEEAIEDFLESAMFNTWDETAIVASRALTLDATARTITAVTGSFVDDGFEVGDLVELSAFATSGNNVPVMLTSVTDLVLGYAGPTGMSSASEAAVVTRCHKLTIGVTKKSLSIQKSFLDLSTKALIYRGCLVSQMELNIEYGSLISGSFDTNGNDYDSADAASEFASYLEYIQDPATTNTLNGSVDMPFTVTNVTGSYVQDSFCIQSLKLNLQNNLTSQVCIGKAAPENYNPGTAQIGVEINSYLKDANWNLLDKKLTQAPFAVGFMVKNTNGYYGFYLPAIQVSFEDPSSQGQNQDVSMEMKGTAKVGANGESALSIFRAPA